MWDCVDWVLLCKLEPLLYRDIAGRLRQRRLCSVVQCSLHADLSAYLYLTNVCDCSCLLFDAKLFDCCCLYE